MEGENKDASLTLGISIPVNPVQSELHYLQNQGYSSTASVDYNKYYGKSSDVISDSLQFCNLTPSLDPNLGILGSLTSSNIPYEKSPFNSWNIEPHFLHVLPLSTTNNDESSILIFGGLNPFSVAEKKSFDFDHEDFVLGSTIFEYLLSSGVWKYYGTMIEPRCYHACVLIDQHVYITGGYSLLKRKHGEMLAVSSTDRLDLQNRQWKRCADMITARAAHAAVSHTTYLYVFGGRNAQGNILSSVEVYYSDEDLWMEISFLPSPAMGSSAVCVMDSIWLLGGITANISDPTKCLSSDVFSFMPSTKRWSAEQSLPRPCAFSACISDGHSLWLIGGCTFSESSKQDTLVSCSSIFRLSLFPTLSKWRSIASLLHPRHALTAVLFDETIYVFGGIESASNCTSNKVEMLNTTTKMSIESSKMPASIAGSASILISHKIQDSLYHSNIKSAKKHSQSSISTDYGTTDYIISMDRENVIIQKSYSSSSKEKDITEDGAMMHASMKHDNCELQIKEHPGQNLIQRTELNSSIPESEVKEGDVQKNYNASDIEKNIKKHYSDSGIKSDVPKCYSAISMEKDIPKSYSATSMEKDIPKSYSATSMEKDIPKRYSATGTEKDIPKSYSAATMEKKIPKSFSATSMEKDIPKSYCVSNMEKTYSRSYSASSMEKDVPISSSIEKDVPKSCSVSNMGKDAPKSYNAASIEKDAPKSYSASNMEEGVLKNLRASNMEEDVPKNYSASSMDKDVQKSYSTSSLNKDVKDNEMKHAFIKRDGGELQIKNSDKISIYGTEVKDSVIRESSGDLEVKEKGSFDERRNSKTHPQSIQDNTSSNVRYRASVEIFLNSGMSIKEGNLAERKSSAAEWLKYFETLSPKGLKDVSSSKETDEIESSESDRMTKESYSGSEQVKLIGQKDNFVSTFLQSAKSARKSLLYVHSNLTSQLSVTESCVADFNKIFEFKKSAELEKDSLSAVVTDSTRISLTQESLPNILVMGGEDPKGREILSYSCNENNWECCGYMPEYRCHHSVIFLNRYIYIIGGFDSQNSKNFEKITGKNTCYDFYKEMWLDKASMMCPRAFHAAIIMKDEILVLGGRSQSGIILASVEVYNQSHNEWREREPLPYPVLGAAAASVRGVLYLFGGITYEDENEVISSRTVIFDPKYKSWSSGPDMPTSLAFCGVSAISNFIWLFGGLKFENQDLVATEDVFRFDLAEESWNKVAELSVPRHAAVTVSLGVNVYIMGGYSPQAKQEVVTCELLDTLRKQIFVLEPLPIAVSGKAGTVIISLEDSNEDTDTATLTDSSKISLAEEFLPNILVTGGEDPKGTEILSYNFNKNSWECCGYIPEYRCHHCVIFLNHCFYVIGGFDSQNSRDFEKITGKNTCYDFRKQMWFNKASMMYPRAYHAAILMNDEIFVLGGRDHLENIIASVEIYNQSQGEWREGAPLPYPVLGVAAASVKGVLYLFGGITYEDENEVISSRTAVLDPKHKSWSSGPGMPAPLAFSGVSATSNSIWLFGGLKFENEELVATEDVFRFDLVEKSWSQVAKLSIPRHAAVTVSLGTKVYVIGGYSPQAKREVVMCEQVDTSKIKISFIKPLPIAISGKAGAVITSLSDSSENVKDKNS